MSRKLIISIPEIMAKGGLVPQSFEEALEHIHRPGGYWNIIQRDKLTGEIVSENWTINTYTDNGCSVMWKAIAGAGPTYTSTPGNILAIDQSLGMTTTAATINAGGTVTSITVGALTGPNIPSGTKLIIDPGSGHQNFGVKLTQTINGAGTFNVTSTTGPGTQINSGAIVRYDYTAVPTVDPTSLSSPVSYTAALPSGNFVQTLNTGYGNRQVYINNIGYLFSTTGSPAATAASYTCAWLCNTSPVSANNQTFIRVSFDQVLIVNASFTGEVQVIEKL